MALDIKKFVVTSEDKEKKVVTFGYEEANVFKDHLKDNEISESVYSKVKHAEKAYNEEVASAATDVAFAHFKKDKKTEAVVVKMPFGIRGTVQAKIVKSDNIRDVRSGQVTQGPTMRMKVKESIVGVKHLNELKAKLVEGLAK